MRRQPTSAHRVSVALLLEQRYLSQRQPLGLARELRRRGCDVVLVDPDSRATSLTDPAWLADVDLCVARGRSDAVLSSLLVAEQAGIPTVNRHGAIRAVHDKAAMAVSLAGAGIPTPATTLGCPSRLAADLPAACFPVLVKPIRGDNCRGLRLCERPDDLAALGELVPDPVLAQPYLPSDGTDVKLYGIGDAIWAVRKPSPFRSNGSAPVPPRTIELSVGLRELARRCADVFGLELYGVDCLLTPAGPVVIEVNEYPNYSGVDEADGALASHLLARLPARVAS
jgi:ribosomal protein S6--L-glutamate ligase